MSVLSDIYISRDNEAGKYDTAAAPFTERAQYKGITPLELSTLWTIMRGVEWDVAAMDDFGCLLQIDGGERLIHSFPAAMLAALGELTPDRIRDVTVKWAATDELACSPADIQPVVEEMVRLARSATTSGRSLYLWNCV
ncbi:MAG: hypothetical protein JWR69_4739 [Pedosphaera sp.]|nr:hypothetical protein [Pedosphaera sp.]